MFILFVLWPQEREVRSEKKKKDLLTCWFSVVLGCPLVAVLGVLITSWLLNVHPMCVPLELILDRFHPTLCLRNDKEAFLYVLVSNLIAFFMLSVIYLSILFLVSVFFLMFRFLC